MLRFRIVATPYWTYHRRTATSRRARPLRRRLALRARGFAARSAYHSPPRYRPQLPTSRRWGTLDRWGFEPSRMPRGPRCRRHTSLGSPSRFGELLQARLAPDLVESMPQRIRLLSTDV